MAPRNNDSTSNYNNKKNFPVENDNDVDAKVILPCLLHKKHKVVKLVKSQIQKIQEEGLFCNAQGQDAEIFIVDEAEGRKNKAISGMSRTRRAMRLEDEGEVDVNRKRSKCLCLLLTLLFLLLIFLLIFIAVWVSAGPLSNSMAHTPIPSGSFVRTDGLCTLERKYLLRWSKPEHFE